MHMTTLPRGSDLAIQEQAKKCIWECFAFMAEKNDPAYFVAAVSLVELTGRK